MPVLLQVAAPAALACCLPLASAARPTTPPRPRAPRPSAW